MKAIILAAGIGSRLGGSQPKPLTRLNDDEMILGRQIRFLKQFVSVDDIVVIVGFKKDCIMEEFPELTYVFNHMYNGTNTSKSLLMGLRKVKNEDVIWMNGDVVFDAEVLKRVINFNGSCMAVDTKSVGDEEVKYNIRKDGSICEVSKKVSEPLGESVGVNKIISKDIAKLVRMLEKCDANDYFERGVEFLIEKGFKIYPVDVSDIFCIEIDFNEDLKNANYQLSNNHFSATM